MKLSRRDLLKTLTGAGAALLSFPEAMFPIPEDVAEAAETAEEWRKSPCRFCGVGCGVLVGLRQGKVVAVKGDPEAPVNRGLLCIKGYSLPKILYGSDRYRAPQLRQGNKFVEISWDQALDIMASKFKEAIEKHGPESIAMYFSGQTTIFEGYAVNKLMKAGIGSNNIESNARLCMASAVAGFYSTFGMDEPMGCYDDFELTDTFFVWGSNFAEMHPILYSRMVERKHQDPNVKIVSLQTYLNRSTDEPADIVAIFKPHTDLAIANAMAHVIVKEGLANDAFVQKCVVFKKGLTGIGYGVEDNFEYGGAAETNWKTYRPFADKAQTIDFEEYKKFLEPYTPEYAAKLCGVPADTIRQIARLLGDPKRKAVSCWTMGFNQHVRGTWINNLVYNLHLLTGKIAEPGNGPLSLTGQPSACGTSREVGVLAHALPGGKFVANPEHRQKAAHIWNVPVEKISPRPGYHAVEMFRALDRGDIKVIWINTTNPFQTLPNVGRYRRGARKGSERFVIVSEVYPSETARHADLILPSAMWVEKEGMVGNTERRTQHWFKMVNAPGQAKDDLWQIVELAKRLDLGRLFDYGEAPLHKALFEEYRQFGEGSGKDLAPYDVYAKVRGGLRWPVVEGRETRWRYREGFDPYVKKGDGVRFYGQPDGRAVIWARPYEPPAEQPDEQYPFWLTTGRVLEHWHTGTITRRVLELHRAVPFAPVWINPEDAGLLGIKAGNRVRIQSRRGEVITKVQLDGRNKVPKGVVFVPFFDENVLINLVTLDAYDPISKQPDYKKCAVRIEKV
ncbi:MAG: periplasmic nitrate reductase subunit alpha [Candidatus Methylomirabilota bacterium]|nr:MAG: periplasmic nitrate reductase subunit alpha [candidate division NC10 bacterium]